VKLLLLAVLSISAATGDFVRFSNQAAKTSSPQTKLRLYSRALASWTRADGDRNKGVVLANRAGVRHQVGDYEGAIKDLDASMEIIGENALTRANHGAALASLGRHAEAIEDFTQAIRLEPRNPTHYASRAIAHDAIGKTEQAILDYNDLLSFAPSFKNGNKTRGSLLFKAGRYAEAVSDFDAAIALNRNDRRAYQLKALAEAAIEQTKKNKRIQARNKEMQRRAEAAKSANAGRAAPMPPIEIPDIDPRFWLAAGGLLLLGIGFYALK